MKKKNKKTSVKNRKPTQSESATEAGQGQRISDSVKKTRTNSVNYEEFVRVWCGAATISEVAEVMGIKSTSATAIASRLRKAGVPLPRFQRRGAQAIDVKKLNKILTGKAG